MRDDDLGWEIEFQAKALAEKTVHAPLEALAPLCVLAENIIEKLMGLPDEPPVEAREMLGLESLDQLREFLDSAVLKFAHSPQDTLALYLYQGQAARKAGISPRDWLRVHRLAHLASLKVAHHFQYGSRLPDEIRAVFYLDHAPHYEALKKLHAQFGDSLPERLRHLHAWSLEIRKVAAAGLLGQASSSLEAPIPAQVGARRPARIPLGTPPLPAGAIA